MGEFRYDRLSHSCKVEGERDRYKTIDQRIDGARSLRYCLLGFKLRAFFLRFPIKRSRLAFRRKIVFSSETPRAFENIFLRGRDTSIRNRYVRNLFSSSVVRETFW